MIINVFKIQNKSLVWFKFYKRKLKRLTSQISLCRGGGI